MTANPDHRPVVDRCLAYRPCEDVTARLVHADIADRHGMHEQAERLRSTAAQRAAEHNYGIPERPDK
jgi:hypothetical protein